MKTMCPPSCYHNGFLATHAFWHMMYIMHIRTSCAIMCPKIYNIYNKYIYIYIKININNNVFVNNYK